MYDFDQPDEPQGWQNPALAPGPWTSADNLELQQVQQGMAGARKQLYEGEIDQPLHDDYMRELQGRAGPLLMKQKQAQKQAMQEQQAMLMHQHAQQEAMGQQAATFRAQTIQGRIVPYVDEMTGERTHLYESSPGQFEELKFERHAARDEAQQPESIDYNPLGGGLTVGGAESGQTAESPASQEREAAPNDASFAKPDGQKPFVQEIYNGPQLTRTTYQPTDPDDPTKARRLKEETFDPMGKQIGMTTFTEDGKVDEQKGIRFDQRGQPIGELQGNVQAGKDKGLINNAQIDQMKQDVARALGKRPMLPPNFAQLPPQAQIALRQQQAQYDKESANLLEHYVSGHLKREQAKVDVQAKAAAVEQKAQNQAKAAEEKQASVDQEKERRRTFTKHLTDLHNQRRQFLMEKDPADKTKKLHAEEDLPEELRSNDAMEAEATRMMEAGFKAGKPKNETPPGGPGAGPGGNDKPPAVPGASPGTQTPPTQAAPSPNVTPPGGPGAFHPEAAKARADLFNNDPKFKRALVSADTAEDRHALMTVRDMIAQYGPPASIPPQKQILFRQAAHRAKQYMPELAKYAPE